MRFQCLDNQPFVGMISAYLRPVHILPLWASTGHRSYAFERAVAKLYPARAFCLSRLASCVISRARSTQMFMNRLENVEHIGQIIPQYIREL